MTKRGRRTSVAENRRFRIRAVIHGIDQVTDVIAIDEDLAQIVAALEFDVSELPSNTTITEVTDEQ